MACRVDRRARRDVRPRPRSLQRRRLREVRHANGRDVRYWRVANAQHFDAFLGLPPLAARYVPLLPYAYRALDAMWAHVHEASPLPASARIDSTPRAVAGAAIEPLATRHLALP